VKRLHIHIAVEDLERSISFYSVLFASRPSVAKLDYAKWTLDDPAVNLAISRRGATGIDHHGIQVDRRRKDARPGGDNLLLRPVQQILGRRSDRLALGDVLHVR
jgi:catechol 2,3-dioxygenase-like lactoylglutathione lyase family enzyme